MIETALLVGIVAAFWAGYAVARLRWRDVAILSLQERNEARAVAREEHKQRVAGNAEDQCCNCYALDGDHAPGCWVGEAE